MISKEEFENIKMEHGCGYWNVCSDHACTCRLYGKELSAINYNNLVEENRGINDDFNDSFNEDCDSILDEKCDPQGCKHCQNRSKCAAEFA